MTEIKKIRVNNADAKHRDLYHNYLKVLAKYGDKAKCISRTQLAIEANTLPAVGGFYYKRRSDVKT